MKRPWVVKDISIENQKRWGHQPKIFFNKFALSFLSTKVFQSKSFAHNQAIPKKDMREAFAKQLKEK